MTEILWIMLIEIVGVLALCILFNRFFHFTIIQSATVTSLISIAIVVPYSIVNWGDGTNGSVDGGVFALYLSAPLVLTFFFYLIGSGGMKGLVDKESNKIHWAPVSLFGFFLILIIVDGAFVALAQNGMTYTRMKNNVSTAVNTRFAGEVPNAYYKKEAYYNEYQRRLNIQKERGWQVAFGFVDTPIVNEDNIFKIRVLDKDNHPIEGVVAEINFSRSAEQELNFSVKTELSKFGEFEIPVNFVRVGRWGLELKIIKDNEVHEVVGETHIHCQSADEKCNQFFEKRKEKK